jgi:hypothetical protein
MENNADNGLAKRRKQAVRTAWVFGIVAALIFISFILSGVLNA